MKASLNRGWRPLSPAATPQRMDPLASISANGVRRREAPPYVCGLLLPYVWLEPAPVDALLVALFAIAVLDGLTIQVQLASWLLLYGASTCVALTLASGTNELLGSVALRYVVIEAYLVAALLLVSWWARRRPVRVASFLLGYLHGAIALAVLLLALRYLGPDPGFLYRDEFRVRVKGTFKDPNVLGPFLLFPIIAFASGVFEPRKTVRVAGLASCVPVLILTFSRGAWVAALVGLAFYGAGFSWRWRGRPLFLGLALTTGAVSFAVVLTYLPALHRRWSGGRLSVQDYDADRVDGVWRSIRVALESPGGIGPGAFAERFGNNPHNLFLGKATDAGLIAAVAILAFVLVGLVRAFRLLRMGSPVGMVLTAVLLGHLVASQFVYSHHWRHYLLLTAVAYGSAGYRDRSLRLERAGKVL